MYKERCMFAITRWSLLVSGLLLTSMAHADALGDLRAKLAGLSGSTPYTGTLTLRSTVTNGKKPATHAQVAVKVASGAEGLQMNFAPALLARASSEAAAQAKNPDAPAPTRDALAKLSTDRVQAALDMAPVLLHMLEGAKKLAGIPGVIVQGRHDTCTPPVAAWLLKQAWPEVELNIIPDAGHLFSEPGITDGLVRATDKFAGL
jgi:pimeloyl-ACP methyl ester carboxylesterase